MNVSRRGLLGMFAAGTAAAIIRTPGLIMPIKVIQPAERSMLERVREAIIRGSDGLSSSGGFGRQFVTLSVDVAAKLQAELIGLTPTYVQQPKFPFPSHPHFTLMGLAVDISPELGNGLVQITAVGAINDISVRHLTRAV